MSFLEGCPQFRGVLEYFTYMSYVFSIQALQEILSVLATSDSLSAELTGSCLLAVAELSSSLGPHLVPLLPPSLPPVIDRMGEDAGVMVQTAAVATLGVIVQTLPKFISSYATAILEKVCVCESLGFKLFPNVSSQLCQLEMRGEIRGEGKERTQLTSEASRTRY